MCWLAVVVVGKTVAPEIGGETAVVLIAFHWRLESKFVKKHVSIFKFESNDRNCSSKAAFNVKFIISKILCNLIFLILET